MTIMSDTRLYFGGLIVFV